MILLADSGSTKTDWRLISANGIVESFVSAGINPALQSEEEIKSDQEETLLAFGHLPVRKIYFYGAGCAQPTSQAKVSLMLTSIFTSAEVEVASDLLGAAKAIFHERSGIACILGTGSNSGFFDGKKIVENVPSLGYLLGDEGGGSQIGKQLLIDYLRGDMPNDISEELKKEIGDDRGAIYHRIYESPFPNRFLASIVGVLSKKYSKDAYFRGVIYAEFTRFFNNCINKYEMEATVSVGFVGSLAFHYQDLLKTIGEQHGINISGIVEKPIDEIANQLFKQTSSYKIFSNTAEGI